MLGPRLGADSIGCLPDETDGDYQTRGPDGPNVRGAASLRNTHIEHWKLALVWRRCRFSHTLLHCAQKVRRGDEESHSYSPVAPARECSFLTHIMHRDAEQSDLIA